MPVPSAQNPVFAHPLPEVFGDYHLMGKIGAGGMAEIYLAYPLAGPRAGKPVALKRMHAHLADQKQMRQMFLSEADIGARYFDADISVVRMNVAHAISTAREWLGLDQVHH